MAIDKVGVAAGPTPWKSKVLKFNITAGVFEGQAVPQEVKCGCGSSMVKDGLGVLYCPMCKERDDKRKT